MSRLRRREAKKATIIALALVIVSLLFITCTPAVLTLVASAGNWDWQRLSSVSTTLGVLGTLLSGLALLGVTISLLQQREEIRIVRLQGIRDRQAEVYGMAISDEGLLECLHGDRWTGKTLAEHRQSLYINSIMMYWLLGFEFGHFSEKTLRNLAREVFTTEPGRLYVEYARSNWVYSEEGEASERRFWEILRSEYSTINREAKS